jgi:hypothetical protein
MGRDELGIDVEVFAKHGNRLALPTYDEGYTQEYEGNTFPSRQGLNDVLAKVSAVAKDVNIFGAMLPWNDGISYKIGATVQRSGVFFVAINDNINSDPVLFPANWTTLSTLLGMKTDREYIPFTSHDDYPISSVTASHAYNISKFRGNGLRHEDIREIHVFCRVIDCRGSRYIHASFPNSGMKLIARTGSGNSKDRAHGTTTAVIPVNSDTTTLHMSISGADWNFQYFIYGAVQRKIGI